MRFLYCRLQGVVLSIASLAILLAAMSASRLPEIFLSPMGGTLASGIATALTATAMLALLLGNGASE
ncbi:MAG: hypothetical protein A3F73_07885 [Gallionellales bacterium RIFCSPLOWO2_12_FULL_59_22]|nr:MAG: hypothetical protein A3H99_10715 [Gallionellales bacterium RIFCSPLOWO2_02_FULL_59_110]OGT01981.1 MAG: hypothetical protein A2Z65_04280 [Gallionellales bacterium RIFCSPLOWO2_02_58_13]OGT13249.1 MAG: hypothetical protein A3F73_07885 [Gallionellales bacterium RIFCSPLOWO2_12_FULL_59_22]